VPIKTNSFTDSEFIENLKNILREKDNKKEITPEEFINELMNNEEFGTSNEKNLEEIITNKKYDVISIKIHFGKDGEEGIKTELLKVNDLLNSNNNLNFVRG